MPRGAPRVDHSSIRASIIENANPGDDVSVPLTLNMFSGLTISGAQFRADVLPVSGAPGITDSVTFVAASGVPASKCVSSVEARCPPAEEPMMPTRLGSIFHSPALALTMRTARVEEPAKKAAAE